MSDLIEQLAAIEHERWADWQRYLHSVCLKPEALSPGVVLDRGCLVIPTALVERWERQIATPYAELSEREKASDREQVGRYWSLLEAENSRAYETGVIDGQSAAASVYKPLVEALRHYARDTVQPVAIDDGEPVYLVVQHDPAVARAALAALAGAERAGEGV